MRADKAVAERFKDFSHTLASSSPKHVAFSPSPGYPMHITPFGEMSGAPHSKHAACFGN